MCGVFGCVRGDVPFEARLPISNVSSVLIQLFIVCTDSCLFFPLFGVFLPFLCLRFLKFNTSRPLWLSVILPPPALSLSVMFWLTSVMVFVSPFPDLQLSGTHAQTYTHSKTANGFYLPSLSQWGITVLVHHEGNLQTHVADRTLSIHAI